MTKIETVVRNYYDELRRVTGSDRGYSYYVNGENERLTKSLEFARFLDETIERTSIN